jgi:predicted nucleic acid-binding protein
VSAAAFDNTMLSALLNPGGQPPKIPGTETPVELPKERAEAVVEAIAKEGRKIILPTPACAELLTAIGPDAQEYLNIVGRSRVFEVAAFDARCAAELAILNREVFRSVDDKNKLEPYQKRKVDRQIIAICKVAGVSEIYTDDGGLADRARLCGMTPISLSECALPDAARQMPLGLEPHETIPEAEADDDEANAAE